MKNSFKQINFDELYIELMEKGIVEFCYAKTEVKLSLSSGNVKEVNFYISKKYGDMHGRAFGSAPYKNVVRSELETSFLSIAGEPLPITDKPLDYVWFISVRGARYPVAIQPDRINLEDYLVSNPQSATQADDEYCFEIDPVMTPLLTYPRKGNLIFIPKNDVWREVTKTLHIKHWPDVAFNAAVAITKYKGG